MAPAIVEEAEKLWEIWNIRVCILLSFFIQICLTFLAPLRKRHRKMSFLIWILYLLADTVALYTIGSISNSSATSTTDDIFVFWSPFLLVHLGGPDTITALALEDNELWLRHLLQLATQSAGTIYLFYRAFRTKSGDDLLIAAVIMYVNGCVKYLERTTSLYLASMDTYRESLLGKPDAGPNYAALMEEYASRKAANIPVDIKSNLETVAHISSTNANVVVDCETRSGDHCARTKEMELVQQAHELYLKFRGLIADTMFTFKERIESREFFLGKIKNGNQAFKIIQIELNFLFDVFYTKVNTLQRARGITRVFSSVSVIASCLLFYFMSTHNYRKLDVYITYVLLGGALFMEVIAVIMLSFCDWAVVAAIKSAKRWCKASISVTLLEFWLRHRPRRWSEEISQYDLLYHCLNDHSTIVNILLLKRVKDVAEDFLYVSRINFDNDIGNLLYMELKIKATAAETTEDAKKACEARGDLVFSPDEFADYSNILRPWTLDVDYDESLLIWHIATNLCILNNPRKDDCERKQSESCCKFQKYSKMLGNYMMYLLIMKPSMTSSVAGIAQVRLQDTCEEAKKFIHRKLPQEEIGKWAKVKRFFIKCLLWPYGMIKDLMNNCNSCRERTPEAEKKKDSKLVDSRLPQLCRKILDVNTEWKPVEVKGDRSKSVLFDACRLAKELIEIGKKRDEEKQWEVTFKVWVELLCYAASRSKPTAHLAQLREGGEFITLVWLLMAHLGLGEQFRINKGTGWAKLIVRK